MLTRASVCFPYRSDGGRRDQIQAWIRSRWMVLFPHFELIWGNQEEGPFNRSRAINLAVKEAHHDNIIIADADTIFHREFVEVALDRLSDKQPWGFPYRGYFNLTKEDSDDLLNMWPDIDVPLESVRFTAWGNENVSGLIVIKKQAFEELGGFDEQYVGWGFEDLAFAAHAQVELGTPFRVEPGYVLHLWHEIAPGNEANRDRYESQYGGQI